MRASPSSRPTPGTVFFETKGVERLYGGLEPALKRALHAVGSVWDARAGAAERRFAALAAANVARPGQALIVSDDRTRSFLAPLPLQLLPLERSRYEELEELGVRTIGQLAGLPGAAVADRLGPDGRRAWSLARGEQDGRGWERSVTPRRPAAALYETLEFPEAVGQLLTLRRGLGVLIDRLLARPERAGRPPRKVAVWARLVGGASWRRTVTLREPTADPARLRAALGAEARRAAGSGAQAPPRGVGARRAHGRTARAARGRGQRAPGTVTGRPAPGEGSRRLRWGLDGGGGRSVVAHTGSARAARSARRLNAPRPALVEGHADGTPRRVNRQGVAVLREEWRVVDRWWTEEPVSRRYFDVVLETGENAVVFHDDDAGSWFTQRA